MLSIPDNTQSSNAFNSTRRRYEQATLVADGIQAAEFTVHSATRGQRKQLESYVAEQYNRRYGARITNFMSFLLSMIRDDRHVMERDGVLMGLRFAGVAPYQ